MFPRNFTANEPVARDVLVADYNIGNAASVPANRTGTIHGHGGIPVCNCSCGCNLILQINNEIIILKALISFTPDICTLLCL